VYLSRQEREEALVLNQALKAAAKAIERGESSSGSLIAQIETMIRAKTSARIDYVKIVNRNMEDVNSIQPGDILALAVFIGTTRLIDNYIIGEPRVPVCKVSNT
jgi:pantoate--beta-alanine ligase